MSSWFVPGPSFSTTPEPPPGVGPALPQGFCVAGRWHDQSAFTAVQIHTFAGHTHNIAPGPNTGSHSELQ